MNNKDDMRCGSCDKFITGTPMIVPSTRNQWGALKVKYSYFHNSAQECADAEHKSEVIRHKPTKIVAVRLG